MDASGQADAAVSCPTGRCSRHHRCAACLGIGPTPPATADAELPPEVEREIQRVEKIATAALNTPGLRAVFDRTPLL